MNAIVGDKKTLYNELMRCRDEVCYAYEISKRAKSSEQHEASVGLMRARFHFQQTAEKIFALIPTQEDRRHE